MLLARKRGVETTQEINVHLVARRHLAATREQYERAKRARTKGRRRSDDSIPVRVTNEERIHQSQMIHDCPQVARNVKEITPRCFDHARRNTVADRSRWRRIPLAKVRDTMRRNQPRPDRVTGRGSLARHHPNDATGTHSRQSRVFLVEPSRHDTLGHCTRSRARMRHVPVGCSPDFL